MPVEPVCTGGEGGLPDCFPINRWLQPPESRCQARREPASGLGHLVGTAPRRLGSHSCPAWLGRAVIVCYQALCQPGWAPGASGSSPLPEVKISHRRGTLGGETWVAKGMGTESGHEEVWREGRAICTLAFSRGSVKKRK